MSLQNPEAVDALLGWLPDELRYSVDEASYPENIARAKLPIDDDQSIHGLLGQEWHAFQIFSGGSRHHSEEEGVKTGQQQLAKFVSGLVDKAALGYWLSPDMRAYGVSDDPVQIAIESALDHINEIPVDHLWYPGRCGDLLDIDFPDTPFVTDITQIMDRISEESPDCSPFEISRGGAHEVTELALHSARIAIGCYDAYAALHLEPGQYELPVSQLATAEDAARA